MVWIHSVWLNRKHLWQVSFFKPWLEEFIPLFCADSPKSSPLQNVVFIDRFTAHFGSIFCWVQHRHKTDGETKLYSVWKLNTANMAGKIHTHQITSVRLFLSKRQHRCTGERSNDVPPVRRAGGWWDVKGFLFNRRSHRTDWQQNNNHCCNPHSCRTRQQLFRCQRYHRR